MSQEIIGIVGLGYVGLPLAVEFGKVVKTIGFDIDSKRIQELRNGYDRTKEVSSQELTAASLLEFSFDPDILASVNRFVITVPTPVDNYKQPDLRPLINASTTVGRYLKKK